ncbi:MAG TPA: hypothetical protein PLO61_08845 [Fimbriimonadaceae bacterium]|nr:hypothetical protein [Fimbriimonadaceae bacterium]HRJ33598.1 hypothetical protein [Fimbriimonadaceae bacterium]
MRVLPRTQAETIQWVSTRIEPWTEQATTLGLDPAQVAELTDTLTETEEAYAALHAAKAALQQAQLAFELKYQELRRRTSTSIQAIRAKAQATSNPGLYAEGSVPPPAKPSKSGSPPAPTELTSTLTNDGFIRLDWKARLQDSPFFTIYRQLPGETTFTLLGTSGARQFVDPTLPAGTEFVSYKVVAHRGTQSSVSSEILQIIFGVPKQRKPADDQLKQAA